MEKDIEEPRVCVVDASTYVGFWILKKLLIKGYRVHAAIQKNGKLRLSFFKNVHRGVKICQNDTFIDTRTESPVPSREDKKFPLLT